MAVYDINGNSLSTVYDINRTSLNQCYDIDGNELMSGGPSWKQASVITNIYTSTLTIQPQGGCIDDDGNIYVCFYHAGKFLKYNIGTGVSSEVSFTGDTYGHANGMTYNPNTGYLYLASMKATGEVYVFDTSFNLVNTLYARDGNGDVFTCWNIAYDRNTERFITLVGGDSGGEIRFYDDSFTFDSAIEFDIADWQYTRQDIETDGEYVYGVGYNPNWIFAFAMDGTLVAAINNTACGGEPESMMYDWTNGNYYLEGKDSKFVIRQVVFKD